MAALSHFYSCSPSEFRAMPLGELNVFVDLMEEALDR